VLIEEKAVNACLILAVDVDGKSVTTIEGLSSGDDLHPLQASFVEKGAIQCGFCTPGMVMASAALLRKIPCPAESDIKREMAGNLCRCTGYDKIIRAILAVAVERKCREK